MGPSKKTAGLTKKSVAQAAMKNDVGEGCLEDHNEEGRDEGHEGFEGSDGNVTNENHEGSEGHDGHEGEASSGE